jgi:hypothetical protein
MTATKPERHRQLPDCRRFLDDYLAITANRDQRVSNDRFFERGMTLPDESTRRAALTLLRNNNVLGHLTLAQAEPMIVSGGVKVCAPGEALFEQGDVPEVARFYVITKGGGTVMRDGRTLEKKVGVGDELGIHALIGGDGTANQATITAGEEGLTAFVIRREAAAGPLRENIDFAEAAAQKQLQRWRLLTPANVAPSKSTSGADAFDGVRPKDGTCGSPSSLAAFVLADAERRGSRG